MNSIAIVIFVCIMTGLLGCVEQKPKEEKPSVPPAQPTQEPEQTPPPEPTTEPEPKKPAAEPKTKPSTEKNVTVVGEVIDIVSYAASGVRTGTPGATEIMKLSAQGGNPLGILENGSGEVFIVTMKQAHTSAQSALMPFIGMAVFAKGDVYRKGGQRLLVMTAVGKGRE